MAQRKDVKGPDLAPKRGWNPGEREARKRAHRRANRPAMSLCR